MPNDTPQNYALQNDTLKNDALQSDTQHNRIEQNDTKNDILDNGRHENAPKSFNNILHLRRQQTVFPQPRPFLTNKLDSL